MFLLAGPAHSAIYTGIWDPTYGAPFNNLGWRGTATFFVPDACKPTGTVDIDNLANCAGLAEVSAAEVEFYDVNDTGMATISTLVFDPASLVIGTLRFVNGSFTALDTTMAGFVFPDEDLSNFGVLEGMAFSLQFTLSGPRLGWAECSDDVCGTPGFNNGQLFPPNFQITEVPEPTSLALAALAVLALAAGRRARPGRA